MNLIKYGVLALSLAFVTACGQKEEAATPAEPATAAVPAPAAEQAPAADSAATTAPAAEGAMTPAPAADNALQTESSTAVAACPTGCVNMNCPPPGGPVTCCKKTATGYKQCVAQ